MPPRLPPRLGSASRNPGAITVTPVADLEEERPLLVRVARRNFDVDATDLANLPF